MPSRTVSDLLFPAHRMVAPGTKSDYGSAHQAQDGAIHRRMEALIPNWTVLVQMAVFFAALVVLRSWLFVPYMRALEMRHQSTGGASATLDAERDRIAELEKRISDRLATVRASAAQRRADALAAAHSAAAELLEQAKAESSRRLIAAQSRVAVERDSVLASVRGEIDALSRRAAERLTEIHS